MSSINLRRTTALQRCRYSRHIYTLLGSSTVLGPKVLHRGSEIRGARVVLFWGRSDILKQNLGVDVNINHPSVKL